MSTNSDEDADHDRTGRPVVIGQPIGSSTTFNEVDIDLRISVLPHSVVKQAENFPVRELVSPRPPQKISYKDNWMCDLDSDIAESGKDTQRIEPKPTTQLSSTRPVCGQESTKRFVLTPKHVEDDQTGTGRHGLVDQKDEHEIDFRVPGLSHAVVKEAEHLRVQELVKRIENLPHREALHADLQQNNVNNPLSNNSKAMIRELGDVELFELCETIPKVRCSHCLLYWNQGIVCCTSGHFLIYSESRRNSNRLRLDALSIPNYVIKKGHTHGARHGKTKVQGEYHKAWNAWKRCSKKVDS